MKKLTPFATAVAAVALIGAGAVAQTTPSPTPAPPAATTSTAPTQQQSGQWRGSQLIGLDIYNNKGEKVGDVTELITSSNGQVEALVVGVGGFLGMGRHDVALRWADFRFVNEPRRPATAPAGPGDKTATPPAAAAPKPNLEAPDHAVISLTTEELKALPAFKYANDAAATTNRTQ